MSPNSELDRVLRQLAETISHRMSRLGWTPHQPWSPAQRDLGQFTKPLENRFLATSIFPWIRQGSGAISVVGRVGIDYGPARDLLVSLAGSPVSGVILRDPAEIITVSASADIPHVADRLVRLPTTYMSELAAKADVDSLVAMLRTHRAVPFADRMLVVYAGEIAHAAVEASKYPDCELELIPALLAGAGRYDEARQAFEKANGRQDTGDSRQRRRFARQLRRLISAEGRLTVPTSPASWPLSQAATGKAQTGSVAHRIVAAYGHARAGREAMDAVRSGRSIRGSHDEAKLMLERELKARGLTWSSAAVHDAIEVLIAEQRPFGTARLFFRLVNDTRALITSATKAQSADDGRGEPTGPPGESSTQPPDRAAYPLVGPADRWTSVQLDPSTARWLDRVWSNSPLGFGRAREIDVWISSESMSQVVTGLDAYIGRIRVGRIPSPDSENFRPAMLAAAERDEYPLTRARLTKLSSSTSFLLELPLP